MEAQLEPSGRSASRTSPRELRHLASVLLVSALCSVPGPAMRAAAQAVTLQIAANVPANSLWDQGLRRMAAEFDRESNGMVKIVIPPTTRTASDSDIIRKMRLGIDGALLNTYGLAELYPDSLALSMPNYIVSDEEFDAVLSAVIPLIKSKIGDRYVVLSVEKGGWVRFFSRSPIVYPADLAGLRISLEPDGEKEISFMESLGARVVRGYTADFIFQLNANGVDAIYLSPIYVAALWSQLRGKIEYMSSFKVAPFVGAIVLNRKSWEKVPADLRPRLERIVLDMSREISLESAKLEEEAIASLDGIRSPPEPPDAAAEWSKEIAKRRADLLSRMFSADFMELMDGTLAKIRSGR